VRASYWLSRLGDAAQRRQTIRWLFAVALAGFAVTMLVAAAAGRGTDRWFFFLVIWLALFFLPLWLITAAFETLGPVLRRRLAHGLAGRQDRYGHLAGAAVMVEDLFARRVVMPRIATPHQGRKAREAAVALILLSDRGGREPDTLQVVVERCLAAVEAWGRALGPWAAAEAGEDIQARWGQVRAFAALTALTKTLLAVFEDRTGGGLPPGRDGRSPHAFLDSALDYSDELALQVDASPWGEPPLAAAADPERATRLRQAWQLYADAPQPAAAALKAFLAAALAD
jgi:hypothetical protein